MHDNFIVFRLPGIAKSANGMFMEHIQLQRDDLNWALENMQEIELVV